MDIRGALTFLEAVFGSLCPADRVAAAEIEAAEARLGARLPASLRTLYSATGASKSIHAAHNELVSLARIDFAGEHLVFYEENQAVVVWGILRSRLAADDPPVDQGQHDRNADTWTFEPEFQSVSEFVCAQGAWQAVQGGLPYVGVLDEHPDVAIAKANGKEVDRAKDAIAGVLASKLGPPSLVAMGMSAWLVEGGVAVELPKGYVGLATRESGEFEVVSERIGLSVDDWDYATLRDEY